MLRSKGLTEKMILLGIDGMDPRFTRKMVEEGKMPNVKKLMDMGACRDDLMLLGGVPTITPPMWTTLATGAYPMTHGITDFNINFPGELDINYSAIYSTSCHAEQLWNITAEAGKKTLVWHWPGASWPPSSDSPNLYVVDGTSPGSLGAFCLRRDYEGIAVASDKTEELTFIPSAKIELAKWTGLESEVEKSGGYPFTPFVKQDYFKEYAKQLKEEVGDFNGYTISESTDIRTAMLIDKSQMDGLADSSASVSLSPFVTPTGWATAVPEGAKEFTITSLFGRVERPALLLKNEAGVYDRVAYYVSKEDAQPAAILEKDVFTSNVVDMGMNSKKKQPCKIIKNMRVMELAEDGSIVKIWISDGMDIEDKSVFYPQWIHDEIVAKFGAPVPTSMIGAHDKDVMYKCTHEQWKKAAMWQANCMKYMMDERGVDVIFSHYHGPDLEGHTYVKYLKERETSTFSEAEIRERAEATYKLTDDYIGEFLPYIDKGYTLSIFSDHALICRENGMHTIGDNYGVNAGVMKKLGYTVLKKDAEGNETNEFDWEKTVAVQQRANSIYINLKGRDRFGVVDPADKYELEEKIITDLYNYKDPQTGHRIISLALHNKDAVLLGVGGPYAADIIFFVHDDYNFDHGESLSTATGYADTSTSPIFLIAGPGIKEGFRTDMYVREVDIAPTAAVLLGVDIPAQCEGAPAYQLLTEKL